MYNIHFTIDGLIILVKVGMNDLQPYFQIESNKICTCSFNYMYRYVNSVHQSDQAKSNLIYSYMNL